MSLDDFGPVQTDSVVVDPVSSDNDEYELDEKLIEQQIDSRIYYNQFPIRIITIHWSLLYRTQPTVYVHAVDLCTAGLETIRVCNIARLFNRFETPSEKLLLRVTSPRHFRTGRRAITLTIEGVRRFLSLHNVRDQDTFRDWIEAELLPRMEDVHSS